ncbi:T-cell surface glycoprotein CD3 epsilon chain-like [Acanthopagrus latus]|uniref:T-cell surface glycoprotein CD3 epsilon chain-like n=1 Tax=Acanthopagrus latus TaxID=8177 RepID=UPI00187BF13F|nr:T-cell surface glycoprotein CD3 epsilon chain-like [Acanthopagrus latus]
MTSMGVRAAFAVFLLFVATVKADEGGVSFWQREFTLTCPKEGKWFQDENNKEVQIKNETSKYFTMEYTKKGSYHCVYDSTNYYYFYVQGKVCDNCYELDSVLFLMAIVVDILMTICVMFIVYKCTKKKSPAGLTHTSKPPPRSGGRGGPPVPSPDYEQLNLHTRSHDTYSKVNRTG